MDTDEIFVFLQPIPGAYRLILDSCHLFSVTQRVKTPETSNGWSL